MKLNVPLNRLRALPVHVIENDGGAVVKRGRVEITIRGEGAAEVVREILGAASGGGASRAEIVERYAPADQPFVEALVEHLVRKRLLVAEDAAGEPDDDGESQLEIFYWHFGERQQSVAERMNSQRILIAGVNCISRQLAAAMGAMGVDGYSLIDYPLLRNLRLFDGEGRLLDSQWPAALKPPREQKAGPSSIDPDSFDFLVVTSDFGGLSLLREWNEFCVLNDRPFLPVVLQDLVGYVGPILLPRRTACFECFLLRRDAHMSEPRVERAAELTAFDGQSVVGFHPSMASVLGDLAAFELTKFYGLGSSLWTAGTQIEVNLTASTMKPRKVLRLPRCPVCTTLHERTSATIVKNIFLPGPAVNE